jgi:hypothetical protein
MRTFYHLLLFASCLLLPAISQAQTVNIESALRYWEITDALRRDELLTDQVWRNFLALPGNRIYVDAVYSQDQLPSIVGPSRWSTCRATTRYGRPS